MHVRTPPLRTNKTRRCPSQVPFTVLAQAPPFEGNFLWSSELRVHTHSAKSIPKKSLTAQQRHFYVAAAMTFEQPASLIRLCVADGARFGHLFDLSTAPVRRRSHPCLLKNCMCSPTGQLEPNCSTWAGVGVGERVGIMIACRL